MRDSKSDGARVVGVWVKKGRTAKGVLSTRARGLALERRGGLRRPGRGARPGTTAAEEVR